MTFVDSTAQMVLAAVDDSRKLSSYGDDWDENGSPAVDPALLAGAQKWILASISNLSPELQGFVETLCFLPGPAGGVDVLLRGKQFELVFAFQPDGCESEPQFFGEDLYQAGRQVAGTWTSRDSLASLLQALHGGGGAVEAQREQVQRPQ
ncbi:MAG: hypothetical protein U1A78_33650 [Polyangia bacterium]